MTVLDLTQAARLFYGATEVGELWRDGQRLWPHVFGPTEFAQGADYAVWYDRTAPVYQDAGGTIPASIGDPVGLMGDGYGLDWLSAISDADRPTLGESGLIIPATSTAGLRSSAQWTVGQGMYLAAALSVTDYGGQPGIRGVIGVEASGWRYDLLGIRYTAESVRWTGRSFRDVAALTGVASLSMSPAISIPFVIESWVAPGQLVLSDAYQALLRADRAPITPTLAGRLHLGISERAPIILHGAMARQGPLPSDDFRAKVRAKLAAISGAQITTGYGPELLSSPEIAASWNAQAVTLSDEAGGWVRGVLTSSPGYFSQAIPTEIGERYAVWGDVLTSVGTARVVVGTSAGASHNLASVYGTALEGSTFLATSTTTYISVRSYTGITVGDWMQARALSCRKVVTN